jgi:hypothetical protein
MKTLIPFANVVVAISVSGLIAACQTTPATAGAAPQKETLLLQAGFKARTVSTPKQQQRVGALLAGDCRMHSCGNHFTRGVAGGFESACFGRISCTLFEELCRSCDCSGTSVAVIE